jgi:hypothetical protein
MTGAHLAVCVPYLDGPPAGAVALPAGSSTRSTSGPREATRALWLERAKTIGSGGAWLRAPICCVRGRERRRGRAGQEQI